jgi:hypothetical protein
MYSNASLVGILSRIFLGADFWEVKPLSNDNSNAWLWPSMVQYFNDQ